MKFLSATIAAIGPAFGGGDNGGANWVRLRHGRRFQKIARVEENGSVLSKNGPVSDKNGAFQSKFGAL